MVKKISSFLIIILFITISILTVFKMNKNHENKLYNVLYSEIKYAANTCYLEKKCNSEITLQTLYDNNYLNTEYDPITKEELNKDLKITIKNNDEVDIEK